MAGQEPALAAGSKNGKPTTTTTTTTTSATKKKIVFILRTTQPRIMFARERKRRVEGRKYVTGNEKNISYQSSSCC